MNCVFVSNFTGTHNYPGKNQSEHNCKCTCTTHFKIISSVLLAVPISLEKISCIFLILLTFPLSSDEG